MSLAREMTVACPKCGLAGAVTLHGAVDAAREPELKSLLCAGRLSLFACASCGAEARIAHPLLYADRERGFFVQLEPEGAVDGELATRLFGSAPPRCSRLVRDGNALIEKIRIDEAGLDDRAVEVWKLVVASAHGEHASDPWYFDGVEEDGSLRLAIAKPTGLLATRRPRSEYDFVRSKLEESGGLAATAPFAVVDRAFAFAHLEASGA